MIPRFFLLALTLMLPLAGCAKVTADKAEAARTMDAFYDHLRQQEIPAALDFYAPEFFERNGGRERWAARWSAALTKLGALRRAELRHASTETQLGREGGTFLLVVYRTEYERGTAEETLRLKQSEATGGFKIFSHEIRSAALREAP